MDNLKPRGQTEKEIKNFYEERSDSYLPSTKDLLDDRFEKIVSMIIDEKPTIKIKVLDVGCGNGFIVQLVDEQIDCDLYGFDISKKKLDLAQNVGVNAILHDVTEPFPFPEKSFDIVICSEVLEHLLYPEKYIKSIYEVLKEDCIAIFTTPNYAAFQIRFYLLFNGYSNFIEFNENKEHIRFYSKKSLSDLLSWGGSR